MLTHSIIHSAVAQRYLSDMTQLLDQLVLFILDSHRPSSHLAESNLSQWRQELCCLLVNFLLFHCSSGPSVGEEKEEGGTDDGILRALHQTIFIHDTALPTFFGEGKDGVIQAFPLQRYLRLLHDSSNLLPAPGSLSKDPIQSFHQVAAIIGNVDSLFQSQLQASHDLDLVTHYFRLQVKLLHQLKAYSHALGYHIRSRNLRSYPSGIDEDSDLDSDVMEEEDEEEEEGEEGEENVTMDVGELFTQQRDSIRFNSPSSSYHKRPSTRSSLSSSGEGGLEANIMPYLHSTSFIKSLFFSQPSFQALDQPESPKIQQYNKDHWGPKEQSLFLQSLELLSAILSLWPKDKAILLLSLPAPLRIAIIQRSLSMLKQSSLWSYVSSLSSSSSSSWIMDKEHLDHILPGDWSLLSLFADLYLIGGLTTLGDDEFTGPRNPLTIPELLPIIPFLCLVIVVTYRGGIGDPDTLHVRKTRPFSGLREEGEGVDQQIKHRVLQARESSVRLLQALHVRE